MFGSSIFVSVALYDDCTAVVFFPTQPFYSDVLVGSRYLAPNRATEVGAVLAMGIEFAQFINEVKTPRLLRYYCCAMLIDAAVVSAAQPYIYSTVQPNRQQ